jgi:hypothetical protein
MVWRAEPSERSFEMSEEPAQKPDLTDERGASLLDAEARGGPIAIRGFDFQRAYALILLIGSITDPDWSAILIEGAEDVETCFDRQGRVDRRAVQLKNYRVTAAKVREIVDHFEKLNRDSAGTWTTFVIACTGLDEKLLTIHNGLERYRPLHSGSFYGTDDAVLANTREDVKRQIGACKLPVDFVLEQVAFEPDLQAYKDEDWVRGRALDLLQKVYPAIGHAAAEEIYLRLAKLVSESTGQPIVRRQVEEIIDAARAEPVELREGLRLAERASLERQLSSQRENLLLIEERMNEFVEPANIPLQLIKSKRQTEARIADLERSLGLNADS